MRILMMLCVLGCFLEAGAQAQQAHSPELSRALQSHEHGRYEEAAVAVIMFDSCQMDDAMRAVEQFHGEYDPLRAELADLLERSQGPAS
jgi:hypothetical protein